MTLQINYIIVNKFKTMQKINKIKRTPNVGTSCNVMDVWTLYKEKRLKLF